MQTATLAADVAVLFDASLSMRNQPYAEVRQAVIAFASALTDQETLHLRIFGDVTGAPLEGPAEKLSSKVAAHLPTEPLFHHTDLGQALWKALEFLERPEASEVQALFLLTDGLHQPPSGSPFSRDFVNDPDWRTLRERAQALCKQRRMSVYGFGLGPQTDVSLLLRLFPPANVEVVTGNAALVNATLLRVRENLRLDRLRREIEKDLGAGRIEIRFAPPDATDDGTDDATGGIVTRDITIRNLYGHLPVVIEGIELRRKAAAGAEVLCDFEPARRSLSLAPGEHWQGRLQCRLRGAETPWRIGRTEQVYRSGWHFAASTSFSPAAEVARALSGLPPPVLDASPLQIELRVRYGIPYWSLPASLLALSSLAWFTRRRRKQQERLDALVQQRQNERMRLVGRISVWRKEQKEPNEDGVDLSFYQSPRLDLSINTGSTGQMPEITRPETEEKNLLAKLSSELHGPASGKTETARVEFRLEPDKGHQLRLESGGAWRETSRVILCDRDLIEIDGQWRIRYSNHRLRTRAEVESVGK